MKRPGYVIQTRTFRVADAPPTLTKALLKPALAAQFLKAVFARECDLNVEQVIVLALNARGAATGYKIVARGTLTHAIVTARDVFRAAIILDAAAIILAHNHPGGDPSPSSEDEALTFRLGEASTIIGIPLLDHLILTQSANGWNYCSLKERAQGVIL